MISFGEPALSHRGHHEVLHRRLELQQEVLVFGVVLGLEQLVTRERANRSSDCQWVTVRKCVTSPSSRSRIATSMFPFTER